MILERHTFEYKDKIIIEKIKMKTPLDMKLFLKIVDVLYTSKTKLLS